MNRVELRVNLTERSYPIVVTSNELDEVGDFVRQRSAAKQALVVCDTNTERSFGPRVVQSLTRSSFVASSVVLPPGEETKSLELAQRLYARLIEIAADRRTLVIALGGGVIGDLTGFVAATYARGVPLLQIPTSLLAQVDSSVGGKVGVNFHGTDGRIVKNMIGAFHQPVGVFIDTETLQTLPLRELCAGLAEVVKYGVILDADFFGFLEQSADAILRLEPAAVRHVVATCCQLKARIVEEDERETGERRTILNYGHTFAHAIEAVTRELRHGEAVAIGMIAASRLAERVGRVKSEVTSRQLTLVRRFDLPVQAPGLDLQALLSALQHDKKARHGRLRFVLPNRIGEVEVVDDVPAAEVAAVVGQLVAAET